MKSWISPQAPLRRWPFWLLMGVLTALLLLSRPPYHGGDANEYLVTTVALASHASPDIRLADVARARALAPSMAAPYALLEDGLRHPQQPLYAAYYRGQRGAVYAVHFFGYAALAVLPFKLLQAAGLSPLYCYQIVNLALLLALGGALLRVYRSTPRALAGVALFLLCGGVLYYDWSSPECVSAAALLAALLLYADGAPLRAGLLAGVAALQNPTIVFFFGFAPLLRAAGQWPPDWRALFWPRALAGLALGLAVVALAPLFNLWAFGVPNIIAQNFTTPALIGWVRLHSFYFDLNQGMLVGAPFLLLALLLALWRGDAAARRLILLGAALTLSLSVPALAINNWNSGAHGVMRYGFWSAMPLLFALLWLLRGRRRWPWLALGLLIAGQAAAMWRADSYPYVQFSPQQAWLLRVAPAWSNPEPEIFAERAEHSDDYLNPARLYAYRDGGLVLKALHHRGLADPLAQLCPPGVRLQQGPASRSSVGDWVYLNGPMECEAPDQKARFLRGTVAPADALRLRSGWNQPESGGGAWDGVWSEGGRSRLALTLAASPVRRRLLLRGHYFDGNRRTRVHLNGADLGWLVLDGAQPLALPAGATSVDLLLEHEAPRRPGAAGGDPRQISYFLQHIALD